ncbi:sphinganine kinase lcb4 [Ceratocystis pirilliformis]|uniref:Sphinganine kinase lcb4 n=1 Tax=Ceratocystis pirilliformis TaxID=259994 RepID=A0ABR3ZLS7_9PEZI
MRSLSIDERVPFMAANEETEPTAGSLGFVPELKLSGKRNLVLRDKTILLKQTSIQRSLCLPSKPSCAEISFYNILWVESNGLNLSIDYVEGTQSSELTVCKLEGQVIDSTPKDLKEWATVAMDRAYGTSQRKKRALVLVNPRSGPGGGEKKWATKSRPIFEAARMPMDIIATSHGGQATDICEKMDIDNFDIVVGCAGDGMPYEIFNGLGKRADASRALSKIAVAHIPCGSGNGMSVNLYGTHRPSVAALAIVKGITTPLDLTSVIQGESRLLSFMSQNVGMIAECDLATEHLRWMGDNRFVVGFLQRVMSGVAYPCDIAAKVEISGKNAIKSHYHREQSQAGLSAVSTGKKTGHEDTSSGGTIEEGLPELRYGTLNSSILSDWELLRSDSLGCLYVGNMAFMDRTNNFFPAACPNDGFLDMITVNSDIGTLQWVKLMDAVEKGTLLDNANVTYKKISAFRVTPRDQDDGYISIDGERIPFGPFQCEVHRGLGRVISKNGTFEGTGPGSAHEDWDEAVSMAEQMQA